MTLEQVFRRFLKDNGLYVYRLKKINNLVNSFRKYGLEINEDDKTFMYYYKTSNEFKTRGPLFLFEYIFSDDALFEGHHHTPNRRKYYKLNKKWKDTLKNRAVIQCNINPGDKISIKTIFGKVKTYTVCKVFGGGCYVSYGQNKEHHSGNCSLFSILKVNKSEPIINIYFKEKNGSCYGKLEGEYNEIQL